MLAKNYLGEPSKMDYIETLKSHFKLKKKATKADVYSVKGVVHHPLFKEYALNDIDLTIKLHAHLKQVSKNYKLWQGLLSRIHFQQWKIGFAGVKIQIGEINHRITKLNNLRTQLLAKLPDLTI